MIRRGGPWRVVAAACMKVSLVGIGVGGSGDRGGMGNRNDWLGMVGAERTRVRLGVAGNAVGRDASSSSSTRNGKRRDTTLVWPPSHVRSSVSACPVVLNLRRRSPKVE
ncbi:hypothetical protein ARMGADRAFT_78708 [Armillaria gallica]|uniref:Secreted protein n=1 Tax=Armillaria gallica TaxID=47427 RepID=A0A2H3CBA1_ARMGA|nr:hypothetical protein ARMGADRAFT_78708 [Armillaria gallica]